MENWVGRATGNTFFGPALVDFVVLVELVGQCAIVGGLVAFIFVSFSFVLLALKDV